MNLDELLAKVPEPLRPVVAEYGPALLKMSAEELWAWIQLLVTGHHDAAYQSVLARMEGADIVAEWEKVKDGWQVANVKNTARIALQRSALTAVLQALLTAALSMLGF